MDLFLVTFVTMPVSYCFNCCIIGVDVYGEFFLSMALKNILTACDEAWVTTASLFSPLPPVVLSQILFG